MNANHDRYRNLIEQARAGIAYVDTEGRLTFVNRALCRLLGRGPEEILGQPFADFLHPDDVASMLQLFLEGVASPEQGVSVECRLISSDGRLVHIYASPAPILDHSELLGFGTIVQDVTPHREAEQALRESEALLRQIAANYPNSYLSIVEPDLTIGFTAGQEFQKQGLDPDDFVGLTLEQVFGEQAPLVREYYLRTFAGAETEFELFINDQHQCYRTVPLADQDGRIGRILAVVENVTERKRAEEELQRLYEQTRRDAENKATLLQEVHHRVKNNLQIVSSLLDFQVEEVMDERLREAFRESHNRIRSMAAIHEHLYRSPDLARVEMEPYLLDLVTDLQLAYGLRAITIRVEAPGVVLDLDRATACGLLVNELVSNALKHAFVLPSSDPVDLRDEVRVRLRPAGEGMELLVSDNGVGLPPGLEVGTSQSLGLRLVGMLAQQLKGTLGPASQEDPGTAIRLTFPLPAPRR